MVDKNLDRVASGRHPHPPLWIGGNAGPAMKRAVRFGDAWHPINITVAWSRDALEHLDTIAGEAGRARPSLVPRLPARITDRPLDDDHRLAGEGTIDQIHADLTSLQELGVDYVVLDTYLHDATSLTPTAAWEVFSRLADDVLDLTNETLR